MKKFTVHSGKSGFTLVELSIVAVIIGLLAGSILAGQALIAAAGVQAQLTQFEKYQTAVKTFREKYEYLPGDIVPAAVTKFGFKATPTRAGSAGDGDGDGELDGNDTNGSAYSWNQNGENIYFWEDLTTNSGMIDGSFNSAVDGASTTCSQKSGPSCGIYMPQAKIGNGNSVYVYSGYASNCCVNVKNIGPNFFGLSVINAISLSNLSYYPAQFGFVGPGVTVGQAYNIDKKIDDGLPTTGTVIAQYLGNGNSGGPQWSVSAASPSATTCYDTSTGVAAYSMTYKNGAMVTCGISVKIR